MIWKDLPDVVLVAVVARHVVDQMPDRIRLLVYVDAFVPDNGKAVFDYLPDRGKSFRDLAWPMAMAGRSRHRRHGSSRLTR